MPKRCYVPNCNCGFPGHPKLTTKCSMHKVPTDENELKRWNQAIPREDTTLKASSTVCSHHFVDEDLIKGRWMRDKNGKDIFYPWNNWTLKEGAIPRLFPGCPAHLNKPLPVKRKEPAERKVPTAKKRKRTAAGQSLDAVDDSLPNMESDFVLDEIHDNDHDQWTNFDPQSCTLPPAWFWKDSKDDPPMSSCLQFQLVLGESVAYKSIHLKEESVFLCVDTKVIGSAKLTTENHQETLNQQLSRIIQDFDSSKICPGIKDERFSSIKICAGAVLEGGIWRSRNCQTIYSSDGKGYCTHCCATKRALGRLMSRPPPLTDREKLIVMRNDLKTARKQKDRQEDKLKIMENDILNMEHQQTIYDLEKARMAGELKMKQAIIDAQTEEMSKLRRDFVDQSKKAENNDEQFRKTLAGLNAKERVVVRMIIDKANCRHGTGMRYDAEWLMECLLMRIKSPSAYKHLRVNNLLPLPCSDTIRKLLSSMPCRFGFNEEALRSIQRTIGLLDLDLRRGSLVWDEMSITKSVKYDPQKMHFEGFVDYGLDDINEDQHLIRDQLADHCLVFIFRPYRSAWVQPIAVFATKGAAPGHIISRLLVKAIVALESFGARVTSVTCDGAQTNKSAWADCGITGTPDKNGKISCSMKHPTAMEPDQLIWFFQDVPHLFKCVRNFIFTRRKLVKAKRSKTKKKGAANPNLETVPEDVGADGTEPAESFYDFSQQSKPPPAYEFEKIQFKGKEIRHSDFITLWNTDSPKSGGLGIAYKLGREHIFPTNFEKMNVRLMTQLFSRTVSTTLRFYRTKNPSTKDAFRFSEAMEDLVMLLNNAFDTLNGRHYKERITPENWQENKKNLTDLLNAINETESHSLASKENGRPFLSDTSLKAMRVTLTSAIQLVEFLLEKCNYSYVLTGKCNQDCIERYFGIVRSCGGGSDAPTATSFLRIHRMLSMYVPVRNALRIGGNIDDEERMEILTSYKTCMLKTFKDNVKEAADMRNNLKDHLLNGVIYSCENESLSSDDDLDLVQSNATYYLCGYIIHSREAQIGCEACLSTLLTTENELPNNFYAAFVTSMRSKGFLRFSSLGMYYTFAKVERIIQKHFKSPDCFMRDSFDQVISAVVADGLNLPNICCDEHRKEMIPFLIFEYIEIRYHIEAKRYKSEVLNKMKSDQQKLRKLSKMVGSNQSNK